MREKIFHKLLIDKIQHFICGLLTFEFQIVFTSHKISFFFWILFNFLKYVKIILSLCATQNRWWGHFSLWAMVCKSWNIHQAVKTVVRLRERAGEQKDKSFPHHHHVLIKTFLYYLPFHYRRVIAFIIWKIVMEDVMWLIRRLDSFRAFKSFLELSSSSLTFLFNLISIIILCISFFV